MADDRQRISLEEQTDWPDISGGGTSFQKDLTDNNSDWVVIGDKTTDKAILVDYSFQLPISGRQLAGQFMVHHDGTNVELDNAYNFLVPEVTGVTFAATIVGNDIRLTIVTASVGENPKMVYKLLKLGLAA